MERIALMMRPSRPIIWPIDSGGAEISILTISFSVVVSTLIVSGLGEMALRR